MVWGESQWRGRVIVGVRGKGERWKGSVMGVDVGGNQGELGNLGKVEELRVRVRRERASLITVSVVE